MSAPNIDAEVVDRQLLLSGDNEDVSATLAVDPWTEPDDVDEVLEELGKEARHRLGILDEAARERATEMEGSV